MACLTRLPVIAGRNTLLVRKQTPQFLSIKHQPKSHKNVDYRKSSKIKQKLENYWRRYIAFLDTYGWKAQSINTCVLVGVGNILSQVVVLRRWNLETFDLYECARYFGVGLFMLGPSMYVWYHGLDKIIKAKTLLAACTKMLMDQTMFLPIYVAGIIAIMGLLCSESSTKIYNDLARDFVPIMVYCYMGWPWIQVLNFYYIPLKHRIFVMNFVGLFYNTLIAWKVEQNRHEECAHAHSDHV